MSTPLSHNESHLSPQPLNLCIPRLPILPGYVDNSYSKVKLAPGIFDSIAFVPWDNFDVHVMRTKEKLDELDPAILSSVRQEVDNIRHKIDPATTNEDVDFDNALQKLFGSSSTQHSFARNSSRIGSTVLERSESATVCDSFVHRNVVDDSSTVYYTNSSSCTRINSRVFDLVENLIKYVRCERKLLLISEMQLSSEVGKKYEHVIAPKDFCNIVPDIALTTTQEHPVRELPICSYELKGPLSVFWERPKEIDDISLRSPSKKKRLTSSSVAEITETSHRTLKQSFAKRLDNPEHYSAKGIAKFYNEILEDSTLLTRSSGKGSYYDVFLPVAQAIVQALLTESGCSMLYTHQEAIAFEVSKPVETGKCENLETKRRPIRVRVSRAFPCDEEPGNICALVALAEYSCHQADSDERKSEVRELFNLLTHRQYEQRLRKYGNYSGGSERGQQAQGGGLQARDGEQKAPDGGNQAQNEKERCSKSAPVDKENSSKSINRPLIRSNHQFDPHDVIVSNDRDGGFPQALAEILETSEGVIGIGSSAIVLGGLYRGQRVAVKSWNGVNREGLHCFLHELEMYKFLLQSNAPVLGIGIPFFRIAKAYPVEDAVLIIDHVGETIMRSCNGKLMMRSGKLWAELPKRDIKEIGRAAVYSLKKLHYSGILHGDISLRNLRVQRLDHVSVKSKPSWRAWWIDLGLSWHCCPERERELEVRECVRLFPEVSIEFSVTRESTEEPLDPQDLLQQTINCL